MHEHNISFIRDTCARRRNRLPVTWASRPCVHRQHGQDARVTTAHIVVLRCLVVLFAILLLSARASAATPIEVTWMIGVGPDRPMYELLLGRFHELHKDIRVRPIWVPASQYQTKLKTFIAA